MDCAGAGGVVAVEGAAALSPFIDDQKSRSLWPVIR